MFKLFRKKQKYRPNLVKSAPVKVGFRKTLMNFFNKACITLVVVAYLLNIFSAAKSGDLTVWKFILSLLVEIGAIAALSFLERFRIKFPKETDPAASLEV
ncbi:hypothetical protein MHB77_30640 [Paenibacillus sp. FSL K6-3166]|uniref:hypothetical protein n=1 Tax=Paenibacillus sp. FSL K6-3166 TaxID=2921492 RepID=UPI0030F84067